MKKLLSVLALLVLVLALPVSAETTKDFQSLSRG